MKPETAFARAASSAAATAGREKFRVPQGKTFRWVVIDVGSKQKYIFATNKQILAMGASELIRRCTEEWVDQAIEALTTGKNPVFSPADCLPVQIISGRTLLLATEDFGRTLIRKITTRALVEGAGLDVWGVIGGQDLTSEKLEQEQGDVGATTSGNYVGDCLIKTFGDLAAVRFQRSSPDVRGLALPHNARCAFTGQPAIGVPTDTPDQPPQSLPVEQAWRAGRKARKRLVGKITTALVPLVEGDSHEQREERARGIADASVLSDQDLRVEGLTGNGWIGVVHADGNGVGAIFENLAKAYPTASTYLDLLERMSAALEAATWKALAATVKHCHEKITAAHRDLPSPGWLLPVIVGGDDLAVALHGAYAWEFATRFVTEFERAAETAATGLLTQGLKDARTAADKGVYVPPRLTMAVGLAFVKPHHPFSHAIALAEELEKDAKKIKKLDVSSISTHTLFESSTRSLRDVRADLTIPRTPDDRTDDDALHAWASPVVAGNWEGSEHVEREPSGDTTVRSWLEARSVEKLGEFCGFVSSSDFAKHVTHAVRGALLDGARGYEVALAGVLERLRGRADLPKAKSRELAKRFEDNAVVVSPAASLRPEITVAKRFSRLVTALDILDVAAGTASYASDTAFRREPQIVEEPA